MKKEKTIAFIIVCFISLGISNLNSQNIQTISPESQKQNLELLRRESAVAEKIQSQLEDVLKRYYRRNTFIINVKVHLSKIVVENKTKTPKKTETQQQQELKLPGLPLQILEEKEEKKEQKEDIEQLLIDKLVFTDNYEIKYIEIMVLLDEASFVDKDIDFVKSIVKIRSALDETRGDTLEVKTIPFPVYKETLQQDKTEESIQSTTTVQQVTKMFLIDETVKPYLFYGLLLFSLLFLVIAILQIMNILSIKKAQQVFLQPQTLPALPSPKQQNIYKETTNNIPQKISTTELQAVNGQKQGIQEERKDLFYELRQLMVTTLVGNPSQACEIFKQWIDTDKDNGIYQVAAFLKATDPRLTELISEHIGQELTAKIEFAMSQMLSVDKEGIIETFKRFREEFQKLQQLKSQVKQEDSQSFQFLKQLQVHQIFHLVKDEPPGIIAIVLAQLSPEISNQILQELPLEKQNAIPVEMGKLKKISIQAYKDVATKLSKKAMEIEKIKYVVTDGVDALIKMLEQSSPEKEQQILDTIRERDITLAQQIRKFYITFDEIVRIPDKILGDILRSVERQTIIKALINAREDVKTKIINNLASRTKIIVTDALKTEEEIPPEDIYSARREITQKIRDMAKSGKIDLEKLFSV